MPTVPAGVVIRTVVDVIVPRVAATPPTVTLVVPVRFVPVITVEVPPKVEYSLTDTGKELIPFISQMRSWGEKQMSAN